MFYGDVVKPRSTDYLEHGMVTQLLKMVNVGDVTNYLAPMGINPKHGFPMVGRVVDNIMGVEGGTGISIGNATQYYGQKGYMLRRKLRIDKCPWPTGQTDMRLRITISMSHTVGNHGFSAPDKVYIRHWMRNDPFEETFTSGTAPSDDFLSGLGYGPGNGSVRIRLEPRGVGPGHPLVWDDENGLSDTFITCFLDNPNFSNGYTGLAMNPPYIRTLFLPCDIFKKHRLNFSDGFVAVLFLSPLGLVEGIVATVEAVGWDTGWHDLEGWHSGVDGDNYQIPTPNSYEYPNYPIDDPFNPTGEGVG